MRSLSGFRKNREASRRKPKTLLGAAVKAAREARIQKRTRIRQYQGALERVAWPIINAFCPNLLDSKKRRVVNRRINRITEGTLDTPPAKARVGWPHIRITIDRRYTSMEEATSPHFLGHEFAHTLKRFIKNDLIVGYSLGHYFLFRK